ncbi:MAG: hypothetical protein IPL25_15395 [Saprospiraceae bacterium]|nr:hypothetical protein [Candidatus Vicinibacter affinis]
MRHSPLLYPYTKLVEWTGLVSGLLGSRVCQTNLSLVVSDPPDGGSEIDFK